MRKEVHTGNMEVGQMPAFDIPNIGETINREPEAIVAVDTPLENDYLTALKFAEEIIVIRIEPSREKNAAKTIDLHVNGVVKWVPVGVPWMLPRKYVEVLARAKPINCETTHEAPYEAANPENKVIRSTSSLYPFTVIRDDNPKGYEWLTRILAEG